MRRWAQIAAGLAPGRNRGRVGLRERILLDLPLVSVAAYDEIIAYLQPSFGLPAFGWKAGDANTPSHWGKAANTTSRLTTTGTPSASSTPWQDSAGNDIAAEIYDGSTARREAASGLTAPGDTDDVVVLCVLRVTRATGSGYVFGTIDITGSTRGVALVFNAGGAPNDICFRPITAGGTAYSRSQDALGAWLVVLGVLRRADGAVWHHVNNATVQSPQTVAAGTLGPDSAVAIGDLYSGLAPGEMGIRLVAYYYGAGLAAQVTADSYALVTELMARCRGICPETGNCGSFARASVASWQDRNGVWHLASPGLPRAGDSSGLRAAPARTNKCYNTINPAATTGWTATGGTHAVVSDAAALLTAGCQNWGPNAHRFVPGAGDEVIYGGAATGAGPAVHSLSVMMRGAAGGESVDIGLRDASSGAVQNCGTVALTTAWQRFQIHGVTPADTDQVFALDCDAGDTIYFIAPQLEAGSRCTTPIPNWATAASAARAAEVLTTSHTPSDTKGRLSVDVAPLGWDGTDLGADTRVLSRAGGASGLLLIEDGTGGHEAQDGTNTVTEATVPASDGTYQIAQTRWGGGTLRVQVDGDEASGSYDGALEGAGAMTVAPTQGEVAVRDLRAYE